MTGPVRLIHTVKVEAGDDFPAGERVLTVTHPEGDDYPACDFDTHVETHYRHAVSWMTLGTWECYRVDAPDQPPNFHYWNSSKLEEV